MDLVLQAGAELARFPLYNAADLEYDMNVVYFVINATFSTPPQAFTAADVSITNGAPDPALPTEQHASVIVVQFVLRKPENGSLKPLPGS